MGTKVDILNEEFQHIHRYNPIEHVKSRIKTPESIVKKLRKNGYDSNIENMVKYVNDIARYPNHLFFHFRYLPHSRHDCKTD